MNLVIDIGNTRTKLGFFEQTNLKHQQTWDALTLEKIKTETTNQSVKKVILSTVAGDLDKTIEQFLQQEFHFVQLNSETPLPILNAYKTPKTLGKDRLAAVVGAQALFPNTNCLVVDAGTCITYDFLQKDGVFIGGNIAPGLKMRLKAMHEFTASLPNIEVEEVGDLLGKSTKTAMQNGALLGARMELEGYRSALEEKFGQIKLILTGGDAIFFAKKLKREIFVNHNLVLIGLNKILNYNVERLA